MAGHRVQRSPEAGTISRLAEILSHSEANDGLHGLVRSRGVHEAVALTNRSAAAWDRAAKISDISMES